MKKILNVYEVSEIKKKGFVIAGTNEIFDSFDVQDIKNFIGDKILLRNKVDKNLYLDVLDIEFSNSLLNKKNIYILVNLDKRLYGYMNIDKLEAYVER